jgi:hypothetical protein
MLDDKVAKKARGRPVYQSDPEQQANHSVAVSGAADGGEDPERIARSSNGSAIQQD